MFIAMGLMLLGMTLGWLLRGRTWLGLLIRRWFRDFPAAPGAGNARNSPVDAHPPHGGV